MKRFFAGATVVGLVGLVLAGRAEAAGPPRALIPGSSERFSVAPSATLTIDGVNPGSVTFTSLSLTQVGNGLIVGTVDGPGLQRALSRARLQRDVETTRPFVLRLTQTPGAAPLI